MTTATTPKILLLTYYWPPSGGSGVQRWMYFAKHLKGLGWEPIVITVAPNVAAYPVLDSSLALEVENITVIRTASREPLRWYQRWSGSSALPQGAVPRKNLLQKLAAFVRGNFFLPDARKGWVPFAIRAVEQQLTQHSIGHLITTGPPHSTHMVGLAIKKKHSLQWWADFRDPWSTIFYNSDFYRLPYAQKKDARLEREVLQNANGILTTVAGNLHRQLADKAPQQRFVALPNGFDADLIAATKAAPIPKAFHIVYTGLLTENHPYEAFVAVLQDLQHQHNIQWTLAGQIAPERIAALQKALPKVELVYLDYLPHKEAVAVLKSAQLLVNFIFKGAEQDMLSGKILEYMATGVPVLSLGAPQSAAATFLAQGTAAKMFAAEDINGIRAFVAHCITQKGSLKNTVPQLAQWSRKAIAQRLIDEVLASG